MSEKSREQISALVDGEQETGSIFILSAMSNNEEFRQAWSRYHLIGEALRGNLPEYFDPDLVRRVSESLEDEASHEFPARQVNTFLKPAAGLAIAASVALVAILGVRQAGMIPGQAPDEMIATNQATPATSTTAPERSAVAVSTGNPPVVRPDQYHRPVDAESRLNRYLLNYNEYRTNAGVQGMLPYVRIVGHEVDE